MDRLFEQPSEVPSDQLPKQYAKRPELRADLGEKERVCEKHGPFKSAGLKILLGRGREIWTECPACVEERHAAERKAEAEQRAEFERRRLAGMLETAAIPKRFQGRGFDSFVADTDGKRHALKVAQDYAEGFGEHLRRGDGLIFAGLPGTGKSHLAGAILQSLLPEHVGLYVTCMGLIRSIRGTWRRESERTEADLLREFGDCPLLVIDEVGVQYGTDGEQTILFDIIDRRYRDTMPTILLTNQDKAGFKEFIGERSYDRLIETSRWVPFDWESYRPIARKVAA
ncbi:ATP-binding protein [Schlegelella sp. S2-27]|uniref:ATP-binding protein n=1 Tax=Caldimonas mangrovi TaxID=2944811 RepID=A0ABT0YVY0_9BURK|nr:ATP-binding protein [Caldimonas mangrovi]MCM5682914.1 ATP-binding protein [Caldimonas mangrovi]